MSSRNDFNYGTFLSALPDSRRIRSYFSRLPLATRGFLILLTLFYVAHLLYPGLTRWGELAPEKIGFRTLYRLNTYPLLHLNFIHYALNTLAFIPLLTRFESTHGTIVTVILFTGPFGLIPGGLYTLFALLFSPTQPTAAVGASVWVFLLLASESIKTWRTNPSFVIPLPSSTSAAGGTPQSSSMNIPTWTSPLFLMLVIHFLVPHTSLLGHLCGAATGYLWGLGYIKFLAPPDVVLKFIESKLNLLGRLPHFVSVDQRVLGRFGPGASVLPVSSLGENTNGGGRVLGSGAVVGGSANSSAGPATLSGANGVAVGPVGSTQRLGS